ncbi:hypothetical protein VB264_05235 [Arcicella aquatica]|uniref:Toxin SymE-like domain-containing protein n=1 Tax=Arcicella aquatica TaxID=217141 RepID=A0ABU5QJR9_9BACT|nr:SymE family type I addiction module toxin [Arcicella aquatica]MEA5257180.1 hypothetical protein [Arcicella aquatica]
MNGTKIIEKNRKIKVSRRYVKSIWKETKVPKIVIAGQYLRDAGFKVGYDVSVNIEQGVITIKMI